MVLLVLFYIVTAKPLVDIVNLMEGGLSHGGDGDLSARMPVTSKNINKEKGVIKRLSIQFNKYIDNIDKEFTSTVFLVGDASEHTMPVSMAAIKVREAITKNTELASLVASSTEEMVITVHDIARSAEESASRAAETVELAQSGRKSIEASKVSGENMVKIMGALENDIADLTKKSVRDRRGGYICD